MPSVSLQALVRTHRNPGGPTIVAVQGLSLEMDRSEYVVLVGPSGAGKTSTLRLVAGLDQPDSGTIRFDGRDLRGVPAGDRDVALVFQDHPLLPHLVVRDHLAFGLRLRQVPAAEQQRRVAEVVESLDLGPLLDRRPESLSGGERQRVALASVLVLRPRVLLLDEPLGQLDPPLRLQLRGLLRRLQRRLDLTVLHVTHDQSEALALADRVVVLRAGCVEQIASPRDAYRRPANLFVARFLGSPPMNLLPGRLAADASRLAWHSPDGFAWPVPSVNAAPSDTVTLGLRAEDVRVDPAISGSLAPGHAPAAVEAVEFLGDHALLRLRLGQNTESFLARVPADAPFLPGQSVAVRPAPDALHLFRADTGQRLD